MLKSHLNVEKFDLYSSGTLTDYVTAVQWSADGKTLAIASAAGEVMLWRDLPHSGNGNCPLMPVQMSDDASIDCIAFSQDGQWLAAGGQDGIKIWRFFADGCAYKCKPTRIIDTSAWVDKLAWSPAKNQLAFSLGRNVQVWDALSQEIVVTLNFEASSVLGIAWSPDSEYLAVAGYQGVKVWHSQDWDQAPYILDVPSASLAVAWSPQGKYLAAANMDRTITVLEWNNPYPWVMRGFPGKVRQLAWSNKMQQNAPLLAASSVDGIVVWSKHVDDIQGWEGRVLEGHTEVVSAIAFQPQSFMLASSSEDGIYLWYKAKQLAQILNGSQNGFGCLAWHPQGKLLAGGGKHGELLIWSKSTRGHGFSR